MEIKFSETKLVGIKSALTKMKNDQLLTNAYALHNQSQANEEMIKDYIFPEIRAQNDLRSAKAVMFDIRSLRNDLQMKKLEEADTKHFNSRLHSILTDIYFSTRPVFATTETRADYSGQESTPVEIKVSDVKPYFNLFKKLSDKALQTMLPLCSLVRLEPKQELFRQHEANASLCYLMISGRLDLYD